MKTTQEMTLLPRHPIRQAHQGQRASKKPAARFMMTLAIPSHLPAAEAAQIREIPSPAAFLGQKEQLGKIRLHLCKSKARIKGENLPRELVPNYMSHGPQKLAMYQLRALIRLVLVWATSPMDATSSIMGANLLPVLFLPLGSYVTNNRSPT